MKPNNTLENFAKLQRKTDPETVLNPTPDFDIHDMNRAIVTQIYYSCKRDPELASRQYNISKTLAHAFSNARMSDLNNLVDQPVLLFKPACDESTLTRALCEPTHTEESSPLSPLHLLASNFSHTRLAS